MKRIFAALLLCLWASLCPAQGWLPLAYNTNTLLTDTFSRYSDNTVMAGQLPLIGPPWDTTGASLPTIASGKLVVTGASLSGYLLNTLSTTPQSIYAEFNWTGGADLTAKGMTIAFADTGGTFLNDLLHLNMGPLAFNLSVRQSGGAFNSILTGNWKLPMANNGTTYTVALGISGNKVSILDPSGDIWSISDSRVPSVVGTRVFWEPGLQPDGLQAQVSKAYAFKSTGFVNVNYTSLNPADISAGLTLSNNNQSIQATTATANKQVRSVDANTNTKIYFETSLDVYSTPAGQSMAMGVSSLGSHLYSSFMGQDLFSLAVWMGNNTDVYLNNVITRVITGTTNAGDVFGVAADLTAQKIWVQNVTKATGYNPAVGGTQNPATGQGGVSFAGLTGTPFALSLEIDNNGGMMTINSGQMPYAGTRPTGFGNWLN